MPKPSAYLWGRCEGWVRVGVFHAVVIDQAGGVCVDEAGEVLMKWVDGSWRSDLPKFEGWGFDQVAVTHVPVYPHGMSPPIHQQKRSKIRNLTYELAHRTKVIENISCARGSAARWAIRTGPS